MNSVRFAKTARLWTILFLAIVLTACGEEAARSSGAGGASSEVAQGGEGRPAAHEAEPEMAENDTPESGGGEAVAPAFERKIVKSAELGLRVDDVREAAGKAQQVAARVGGNVQSSQISRGEGSISAQLVLSVPAGEFERALGELRGLGEEVMTDAVRGEDVTEEFVDLESRERNLLAAEESLLDLYNRAESVKDALAIERELANIRGQIEQVQGRIQYLEQRTELSRIALRIQPVADPVASRPAWAPARVVAQAWNASLGVLQTLATAVISTVVFCWWLAPVPIVGLVLWRRRNRRSEPAATDAP